MVRSPSVCASTSQLFGLLLAALAAFGSACAGDDASHATSSDAGTADRADGDAIADLDADEGCEPLSIPSVDELIPYQTELVETLSGARTIEDTTRLSDRSSEESRSTVRRYLGQQLEDLGLTPQEFSFPLGANVYAELAATDGGTSTIIVGAHFDSVQGSPGADDNASGVAAVLGAVRYLSQLECRTHNLMFMFFDREEDGLFGSLVYAASLDQTGREIHSVHTIDMVGWDSDGDRVVQLEQARPEWTESYLAAERFGELGLTLVDTQGTNSDHESFRAFGFDAVGITEEWDGDSTPHYHAPGDISSTLDFEYLGLTTALVSLTVGRAIHPDYQILP